MAAHPRFAEGHARLGGAHESVARAVAQKDRALAGRHFELAATHLRHAFEMGGGEYPDATIRGLIDLYEYALPNPDTWKATSARRARALPGRTGRPLVRRATRPARRPRENALSDQKRVRPEHYRTMLLELGRGWVYEKSDTVVAFGIADQAHRNIWALFVAPGFEGQGIGTELLEVMVKWLFEQSWVRPAELRCGWRVTYNQRFQPYWEVVQR